MMMIVMQWTLPRKEKTNKNDKGNGNGSQQTHQVLDAKAVVDGGGVSLVATTAAAVAVSGNEVGKKDKNKARRYVWTMEKLHINQFAGEKVWGKDEEEDVVLPCINSSKSRKRQKKKGRYHTTIHGDVSNKAPICQRS